MTKTKKITYIIMGVFAAIIFIAKLTTSPEQKERDAAKSKNEADIKAIDKELFNLVYDLKKQIKQNARDPDSVQFRNESGLCFEYNAKNAFGAYVGFERVCAKRAFN